MSKWKNIEENGKDFVIYGIFLLFAGIVVELILGFTMVRFIDNSTFTTVFIIFSLLYYIIPFLAIKYGKNEIAKSKELKDILARSNIEEIDNMNGLQFEGYLCALFEKIGYKSTQTKASGDFGVDIILEKESERIIVQAKRYNDKVSVSAIQEITAGKNYYDCQNAWVITNNFFTKPAMELAKANNVTLIDRNELSKIIVSSKNLIEGKTA